ncbi:hypothetical protein [Anaeromyxobacter dehalogenans]|uniref:Uncharacterized protein n=1 Tax=Anaeromyxobacter dehalogenans (strain 2CP-C) TaxID=290397 RepID=Q2IKG5_ANADE|nr:hypothetical protein [Anaeromyxobacter dehalogenans]ABC82144.1 hypothetical protein Adeh_2374 [Anaeromyxobacter dehalogenans 2CP-C]
MNRTLLVTASLAALLAAAPALGERERGPSTPAERRKAVEVTRRLEREPLARRAAADRRWLLQWIVEIPDIQVRGCSGPLDPLAEDDGNRFGKILYVQSVFGMAVFQIEHPRSADDWLAVQTAGVESVLRTYRSLLRARPQARWDELDALLAAQRRGRLPALLEEAMEGCDEPAGPAPGDAI